MTVTSASGLHGSVTSEEFDDLPSANGVHFPTESITGRVATVVVFVGNGCPTVRSYEDRLMAIHRAGRETGVQVVAINSNNPFLSPPDTLDQMAQRAAVRGYNFPLLKDADGRVARRFGAVCTPHAFLLDRDLRIVYRGRIDDSRVGGTIERRDLEDAIADVLADRPVRVPVTEPFGCSIVW